MNYTTSRDYEALWNLMQEGEVVVCFLEGLSTYVTIARKNGEYSDVLSAGVLGVAAMTKIDFINQCENIHLEFLPPNEWIKIESDRDLPEINKNVLTYDGESQCEAKWDGVDWENCMSFCCEKEHVTHWKPLPEAPEVGE